MTRRYVYDDIQLLTQQPPTYVVPQEVLDVVIYLESVISIPTYEETPVHTVNHHRRVPHSAVLQKKDKQKSKPEDWSSIRSSFKPTNMHIKTEGIDKQMNDLRVALNKLSNKNYETQKNAIILIINQVLSLEDNTETTAKICHFVFDIASANKFFSEIYANLYQELIETGNDIFRTILLEYVEEFKTTVSQLMYCDPTDDYDGYCRYVKLNDNRRAMSTFIVMLVNRHVLSTELFIHLILHFQAAMMTYLDDIHREKECEELSELLFIVLSHGCQNPALTHSDAWSTQILPTVLLISKMSSKDKTHPSITSRAIFKQLDLVDFINKKGNHGKGNLGSL